MLSLPASPENPLTSYGRVSPTILNPQNFEIQLHDAVFPLTTIRLVDNTKVVHQFCDVIMEVTSHTLPRRGVCWIGSCDACCQQLDITIYPISRSMTNMAETLLIRRFLFKSWYRTAVVLARISMQVSYSTTMLNMFAIKLSSGASHATVAFARPIS
ncbi:hypothetical protein P153DRAFT_371471 [Dothidotthia symphoricarpi CBS 119687]|uniref:Uncharacterized protein n=1 Tax=Dothidotthia symphoricarpi CBS 119687 TaxID=1392245 RepID=A0A6A5ZY56_9PLEO|nr:uncharacterized protein P153DRAFT_371471 [Dothidotthia symphoricarpi CBS 119687]KAF2123813.1 hypothetical protein P153DRAFT_371471 [Dothidotthia symphoricarpi CBS 119687]